MTDRGRVFRRAFSWLPTQFASQSSAPVGAPRQFGSTEHLSTEAVAAFVDGELPMNAHLRAAHHLSLCAECTAEIDDQRRARAALRDSQPISIPGPLLGALSEIPNVSPTDSPTPRLADDDVCNDGADPGAARDGGIARLWAAMGRSGRTGQFADGGDDDRRKRR